LCGASNVVPIEKNLRNNHPGGYKIMATLLQVSWSVSKAHDTYGYNIARLDDTDTGKRYRCSGGGYDMIGTVFGDWLQDRYQDRLITIADRADAEYILNADGSYGAREKNDSRDSLYGMTAVRTHKMTSTKVHLDGGCGIESMRRIAEAVGLEVKGHVNKRGNVVAYTVTDLAGLQRVQDALNTEDGE
jgi:hypothetical protein